jgi:nitroimidazol reductase NimA-like FMN-containing flavoprotein (pyridoxamine 5'-phosphate oxidase superfamily)
VPGPFANPPARERPASPPKSYGVPQRGGTFIDWDHVVDRLATAPAYWLGTVSAGSRPHVVPVWGVLLDGELYLETGDPATAKNRNLAGNERVTVHLDDVDDVVIVHGTARTVRPSAELGVALAREMQAKYPGYSPEPDSWDNGGMVRVEPSTVLAWKDMPTATRWRFRPAA